MELDELYSNIYDLRGVPEQPPFHGFSYGLLIVEDSMPVCCFYIDENLDRKFQFILSNGMIEFYAAGAGKTRIYYGYVTDGRNFFCEEQVYPRD